MRDDERLRNTIGQLIAGWNEKVEYGVAIGVRVEKRVERRWQPSLLHQLVSAQYMTPCNGSDGSGGGSSANKPGSKTPGNLERPDEILSDIRIAALDATCLNGIDIGDRVSTHAMLVALSRHTWPTETSAAYDVTSALSRPVRMARMLLGYDSPSSPFQNAVCGSCGGALAIARDNPAAVRCTGTPAAPPCGTTYPWWDWPRMAQEAIDAVVDTETAVAWIGRGREVLYRWAREGRITRYGGSGKGEARWNLVELPHCIPGQPVPEPPQRNLAGKS